MQWAVYLMHELHKAGVRGLINARRLIHTSRATQRLCRLLDPAIRINCPEQGSIRHTHILVNFGGHEPRKCKEHRVVYRTCEKNAATVRAKNLRNQYVL